MPKRNIEIQQQNGRNRVAVEEMFLDADPG
jgi:hypothetical protein